MPEACNCSDCAVQLSRRRRCPQRHLARARALQEAGLRRIGEQARAPAEVQGTSNELWM